MQKEKIDSNDFDLKEKVVDIRRVAKVTKGGKRFHFTALAVVGNEDGVVGVALGKSNEVPDAIRKAMEKAKKSLVRVPRQGSTIPHEVIGEHVSSNVMLKPASPGTGVIAGGAMRAVLEGVGVTDVLAKSQGSPNPHNVVKATMDALMQMRDAHTVAQHRVVSLGTVFNG